MRVAAVDIGTNSTRLLVADVGGGAGTIEIDRITMVTGLGRGVDADGVLRADAIGATLDVLRRYADRAAELGASTIQAVATSATRDAANREEFLIAVEDALGFRPDVISGAAEAALSFAGACDVATDPATALVIDIGGGSTELVDAGGSHSVDVGSVRLTERCLPHRPASFERLVDAARHAADLLDDVPVRDRVGDLIGVAGTWTALSAIALDLASYDRNRVHLSILTRLDVDRLVVALAALTISETAAIPSLDPARAPVILGGAIVARECMRHLSAEQVTVSEHDLLDGLAQTIAGRG